MGELINVVGPNTRRRLLLLITVMSAALLSTGCTSDDKAGAPPASSASEKPHGKTTSPTVGKKESVEVAPKIPDGTTIAAVANAKGGMEVPLKGGVHKGPLGIMVTCQGKGTVNVSFAPSGLAFPLKCVDGEAITTYNQIDLRYDRGSASISVQASSGVRWAMSVGQ